MDDSTYGESVVAVRRVAATPERAVVAGTFEEENGLPEGMLEAIREGSMDKVEGPTPAQKAYYLWLVMKRVTYVLNTNSKDSMSGVIKDLWEQNKKDGMAFVEKTKDQRVTEAHEMLEKVFA